MPLALNIAIMLNAAPAWPGVRNLPLDNLRAFIRHTSTASGPIPVPLASVRDTILDGPGGPLPIRIYTPQGAGPFPLIAFFHGGDYVTGDLDTQDMIARALAHGAGAVNVSVDYRLTPEHPFTAAADDAFTAIKWVFAHANELNADAGCWQSSHHGISAFLRISKLPKRSAVSS